MQRQISIPGIDICAHAYCLNCQNRRADCIDAFRDIVHWNPAAVSFGGRARANPLSIDWSAGLPAALLAARVPHGSDVLARVSIVS